MLDVPKINERICRCVYVEGIELKVISATLVLPTVTTCSGNITPRSASTIVTDGLVVAVEVPCEFVAVMLNVYEVPNVSPVKVYGEDDVVCVVVDGEEVIVYCVIAEPPVPVAVNVIIAEFPLLETTELIVGFCGTVVAVTPDEADDAELVPYGEVA